MPIKFEELHFDASLWRETSEGYLEVDAPVTKAGIFTYRNGDKITREYRPKEEVFHKDSLDSLNLKAIVDEHPVNQFGKRFLLDSGNTRQFQKGTVSSPRESDGYVRAKLLITDKDLISKIKAGKKGLSCGYVSQDERNSGICEFGEYDSIQRNIRYNHAAVVYQGRAGPDVSIKLDSELEEESKENKMPEPIVLQRIRIAAIEIGGVKCDAIDIEVPKELADRLEVMTTNTAKLVSIIQESFRKNQELQGKYDVLDKEHKTLKDSKLSPAELQTLVRARSKVENAAKFFKLEKYDNLSDQEIKLACLQKKFPAQKFDVANIGYIDGSFDAIYKEVEAGKQGLDDLKKLAQVDKPIEKNDKKDQQKSPRDTFLTTNNLWENKDGQQRQSI